MEIRPRLTEFRQRLARLVREGWRKSPRSEVVIEDTLRESHTKRAHELIREHGWDELLERDKK